MTSLILMSCDASSSNPTISNQTSSFNENSYFVSLYKKYQQVPRIAHLGCSSSHVLILFFKYTLGLFAHSRSIHRRERLKKRMKKKHLVWCKLALLSCVLYFFSGIPPPAFICCTCSDGHKWPF